MELLHFDSPTQAVHYFILCFSSILGVIQVSAARSRRRDLLWLDARASIIFGTLAIAASFVWFFLTDEEIFVPGLAGGEFIAIFVAAVITAVPISRAISFLLARVRVIAASPRSVRVKEPTL